MILDKKVTRKQFLLSALSVAGLFMASKLPSEVKGFMPKKNEEQEGNTYGNSPYGGIKKNA